VRGDDSILVKKTRTKGQTSCGPVCCESEPIDPSVVSRERTTQYCREPTRLQKCDVDSDDRADGYLLDVFEPECVTRGRADCSVGPAYLADIAILDILFHVCPHLFPHY